MMVLLGHDMELPHVLQWCLLWFSAPTALNVAVGENLSLLENNNKVFYEALFFAILSPWKKDVDTERLFLKTIRRWEGLDREEDTTDEVLVGWELEGSPAVCAIVNETA